MQAFVHVMKSIDKHMKETMTPKEAKALYLKQAREMACTDDIRDFANINDQIREEYRSYGSSYEVDKMIHPKIALRSLIVLRRH